MSYLLHLDFSGRTDGSNSRNASAEAAARIAAAENLPIQYEDLSQGTPFVNSTMIEGYFTGEDERTDAHKEAIAYSDKLVAQLQGASALVIGTPIYNFGVPASLKAWADQVARLGVTFEYQDGRPVGLLPDLPTEVHVAYGGTEIGSKRDFATPWLTVFLQFVGINQVSYHAAV